jgi:hypothetical protein
MQFTARLLTANTKLVVHVAPEEFVSAMRDLDIPVSKGPFRDSMSECEFCVGKDEKTFGHWSSKVEFRQDRVFIHPAQDKAEEFEAIVDWFITKGCTVDRSNSRETVVRRAWPSKATLELKRHIEQAGFVCREIAGVDLHQDYTRSRFDDLFYANLGVEQGEPQLIPREDGDDPKEAWPVEILVRVTDAGSIYLEPHIFDPDCPFMDRLRKIFESVGFKTPQKDSRGYWKPWTLE